MGLRHPHCRTEAPSPNAMDNVKCHLLLTDATDAHGTCGYAGDSYGQIIH